MGRYYIWTGVQFNTNRAAVIKAFSKYRFIFDRLAIRRNGSRVSAEEFADAIVKASHVNGALMQRQEELMNMDKRRSVSYPRNAANVVVVLASPTSDGGQNVPLSASTSNDTMSHSQPSLHEPSHDASPTSGEPPLVSEPDTEVSSYDDTNSESDLDD